MLLLIVVEECKIYKNNSLCKVHFSKQTVRVLVLNMTHKQPISYETTHGHK